MTGLDVHILLSKDTRSDWQRQCISSVMQAACCAGFPVEVHRVPGVPGHIGRARATGYARGVHPWVTYVDDDDYVLPHAFVQMRDALSLGVSAVCTPEQVLQNGHIRPGGARHHLVVYRRDLIIDHARWPCCGDVAQMHAIGADAVDMPKVAYVHRVYIGSKARVMRRSRQQELEAARG